MATEPFEIVYAKQIGLHLAAIERKHHLLIGNNIQQQLIHQPEVATRNRKPLRQPAAFGAEWELRFGPDNRFRVLYRVEASERVRILAIGTKFGNRLRVANEEIEL